MNSFFEYLSGSTAKDVIAKNDERTEAIFNTFLEKLKSESKNSCGTFLYSHEGSLQEYLREVEDGVLLYLVLGEFDLACAAKVFSDKADEVASDGTGFGLRLCSLVYANKPVNRIRSAIRIFFVKASSEMFRLIDTVLHSLGEQVGHPSKVVKKVMVERGRYLRAQLKHPLPFIFLPLVDDSANNILHLSGKQLAVADSLKEKTSSNGKSDSSDTVIVIRINNCGSAQVNGDYILTSGMTELEKIAGSNESDICFTNSSGFQLSRSERILLKSHSLSSSNSEIKSGSFAPETEALLDRKVFDWFILNPILSNSYYCCSSFSQATLPPLR
jgi:hypothetical protein